MTEPKDVANALLGSWPDHVARWGREALAAYLAELDARGLTPDMALEALRACGPEQKFPPSAPELAGLARRDPDTPTFEECLQQLYGPGGVFGFKRSNVTISPWVVAFAERYGKDRLRLLEVDHPDYGGIKRQELKDAYERFLAANEGRQVAEIARGNRRQLGKLDPFQALPTRLKELQP